MLKLIAFDFDGTLADTVEMCYAGFNEAVSPYAGHGITRTEVAATFGKNEHGMIRTLVPDDAAAEAAFAAYMAYYETHFDSLCRGYEGLPELLKALRAAGLQTGIVTGKCVETCTAALRHLGIADLFDHVMTGHPEGNIKTECMRRMMEQADAAPEECLYVGDIVNDVMDSRAAGMKCVSAAWDECADAEALERVNPGMVCKTTQEACDMILRMAGIA